MIIAIILLSAIALLLLCTTAWSIKRTVSASQQNALLNERLTHANTEIERLNTEITHLNTQQQANQQAQREQFELTARTILDHQSQSLREQNSRQIDALLAPLKEDITRFASRVDECYANEARERFSLSQRIRELIETNTSIGRKADELSSALRGNSKVQGDWGEMVLDTILQKTGLRRGEEYEVQATTDALGNPLVNENGTRLRPDVVVRYPDGGYIVIDSKVSLTAFIDMINADTPESQATFARQHVASVSRHITELSEKKYQDYAGHKDSKLDFVIMFIPNEGAYSAAMQADPSLWSKAYDKRVIITSPTQLTGALRLIEQMWRHDRQALNAIEIATKSGQLYDKFVAFVNDLFAVQKSMQQSSDTLNEAIKKLHTGKGNLVRRAEQLRILGAKASKSLPPQSAHLIDSDIEGS